MKHLPKPATPSPGESPLPKGLMKLKTSTQANFDKMNSELSKQIEDLKGKGVDVSGLVTLLSSAQKERPFAPRSCAAQASKWR